ncbi:MAG: DNA polymerase III subunit epsilon, partial [Alphaproteobacteria bacterium]|nr:DNA polymerase III subunit epsilon [Alphaproteobacteria bacterium]
MREIVFDTETTGLDPFSGDKLVEIGAVELIDQIPTGRKFHEYINPMRSMSEEVIKIHGLTEEFLSDKPTFEEICDDFLAFVGDDSVLVAHNATFDMKFINCELASVGREKISNDRVVDTLVIARKRFPGSSVNLDELCRRFHIDNSARTVHGALLDAELLADVYLELMGGREPDLVLGNNGKKTVQNDEEKNKEKVFRAPREFPVSEIELEAH